MLFSSNWILHFIIFGFFRLWCILTKVLDSVILTELIILVEILLRTKSVQANLCVYTNIYVYIHIPTVSIFWVWQFWTFGDFSWCVVSVLKEKLKILKLRLFISCFLSTFCKSENALFSQIKVFLWLPFRMGRWIASPPLDKKRRGQQYKFVGFFFSNFILWEQF